MAQENDTEEEPSIEEILASIRQIITDDDEAEADAGETASEDEVVEEEQALEPEPVASEEAVSEPEEPEAEKVAEEENNEEEEILELTETVEPEAPAEEPAPEETFPEPEASPEPEADAAEPSTEADDPVSDSMEVDMNAPSDDDYLFSEKAEEAAMGAFSALAEKPAANIDRSGGVTIEDIVREEMRPMLRVWLDKNLPDIIERLVQEELDRVARRAGKL